MNSLKAAAFIDPQTIGNSHSQRYLHSLHQHIPNIFPTVEVANEFDLEVRKLQIDDALPEYTAKARVDKWWWQLKDKYPLTVKLVLAVLTCFHGPQVESSFSVMGDIINKKSSSMDVSTYGALQTIKYNLKAAGKSALEYFHTPDHLHDRVNPLLIHNMKNAYATYENTLKVKCDEKKTLCDQLGVTPSKLQTKRAFVKECNMA